MAQGVLLPPPTNGVSNGISLTAEELREILEYERIVQFRDAVLAGTHPRIRIPPHLIGKVASTRNISSPKAATPSSSISSQPIASKATTVPDESPSRSTFYNKSSHNQRQSGGTHFQMSQSSEINPVLLEKSDDLIKAEIQLQRQRIERALRDQIDQQRIAAKALLQTSEALPPFDLSEVLTKALAIVHPCTTVDAEPSGAASSASDSFDENTFYSSQHDTPGLSSPDQSQREPGEIDSNQTRDLAGIVVQDLAERGDVAMSGTSQLQNNHLATGLQIQHTPSNPQTTSTSANSYHRGQDADMSDSGSSLADKRSQVNATTEALLNEAFDKALPSPLVRAHNLSPFAPQPARVSPLATAREPPIPRETALMVEAQSAQVAALRNQGGVSSTDSSPRANKALEKKKDKKKKKRKGKDAAASPDTPYIKPEPKSPSPFVVAPLPRPQKRQRRSGQYAAGLNYDEPRYESGPENQDRNTDRYDDPRAPRAYERHEERYESAFRRPAPVYQRVIREDDSHRRVSSDQYATRPQSPTVLTAPYAPSDARSLRAPSQAVIERRFYEEPRHYREPIPQPSLRPEADRERSRSPRRSPIAMGPPRPQTVRLVIDQYGNKFYEPVPAASMRQSVAPPIRYRDELVYERPPTRAPSSRQPIEIYDDDEVVYRRPASPQSVPRRVVTQPEFALPAQPDFRSYRQREYSVRPTAIGPPGEEYPRAPGRRQVSHFEEAPHEHVPRAMSVRPEVVRYERAVTARPEPLPVRYEIPREYVSRMPSVRPEAQAPKEYAPAAFPEVRREAQAQQAYSVRPVDSVQREYVRPLDPPARSYSVRPDAMPRREQVVIPDAHSDRYYDDRRPVEVLPRREYVPAPRDEREYIPPPSSRDDRGYMPATAVPREGRYYEEAHGHAGGRLAEAAFIERPRGGEVIYADDGRGGVDGYGR